VRSRISVADLNAVEKLSSDPVFRSKKVYLKIFCSRIKVYDPVELYGGIRFRSIPHGLIRIRNTEYIMFFLASIRHVMRFVVIKMCCPIRYRYRTDNFVYRKLASFTF